MASDLIVSRITPFGLFSPCVNRIEVEIMNVGMDDAPLPIPVCLRIATGQDAPLLDLPGVIDGSEGSKMLSSGRDTVGFDAVIPCAASVTITAIADCGDRVPNNARNNQTSSIVVTPTPAAWLESDLRIGMQAPNGQITFDPPVVCPGASLIVETRVANKGCAAALNFMTELRVTDHRRTQTFNRPVARLDPGTHTTHQFTVAVAGSGPAPGQNWPMAFDFCADTGGVVRPQCGPAQLCKTVAVAVSAASGSPLVSFNVLGPVRPGQDPAITWIVLNSCADLGSLTATVRFAGTAVYTSPAIPIGLQKVAGEGAKVMDIKKANIPASVKSAIWQIGDHRLDLEVTPAVAGPPLPAASAILRVVPESVAPSWWSWPPGTGFFGWKRAYPVAGVLTNPGAHAEVTPTSVTFTETLSTPPGTTRTLPADSPLTAIPPTASLGTSVGGISQSWPWTHGPDWPLSGPLSQTFLYSVSFVLADEFGNVYASQAPAPTFSVTVRVQSSKLADQGMANSSAALAALWTIAAGVAFIFSPPAALGFFEVAWGFLGSSIWFGAKALDPGLPDFRYSEAVPMELPEPLPIRPEAERPSVLALRSVVELLGRARAAYDAMGRIHRKVLGAYVDGDAESVRAQLERYRAMLGVLHRIAELLPDTVAEAERALAEDPANEPDRLRETLEAWQSAGRLPAEVREAWLGADLPADGLQQLEELINRVGGLPDPPTDPLSRISGAFADFVRALDAESDEVSRLGRAQGGEATSSRGRGLRTGSQADSTSPGRKPDG